MKTLSKQSSLTVIIMSISLATTSLSWANGHKEAPLITLDRELINTTDVYVFRDQSDEDTPEKPSGVIQNQAPAISVSDVNNDGIADVVISDSDKVSVFIGNGDGTFADQIDTLKTSGAIPTGANFLQVVK